MGEREHIQLLKQGVQTWNSWRQNHLTMQPDLSGVDLRGRMLRHANLASTNLCGADLRDANLRHTDLTRARLDGAKLHRAYLSNARLQDTSFKRAVLYETVFANVVLSAAQGLETCIHRGPSVLDHRTIARSKSLPVGFLRGCGLPDFVIAEATAPRRDSARYCSCFISYSSKDQDFADRLYADLQSSGVRCWFAPKDIPIGAKFRDAIEEGIRERERVLLILSKHAVSSRWVEKEVETTFDEESRRECLLLFPIRLDGSVMDTSAAWAADVRRTRHIGDFSGWENSDLCRKEFQRLLKDLRRDPDGVLRRKERTGA